MMKHGLRFGQLSRKRDRSSQKMARPEASQMSSQISAIQEKDALSDLTPTKPRSSSAHTKKNSMQQQQPELEAHMEESNEAFESDEHGGKGS